MKKIIKNNTGYSIIEVLVAFTIITIGLVSILALADQNIKTHQINRNTLIASQLAQEGLELVKNTRDENWLIEGNMWNRGAGINSQSDIIQDGTYTISIKNAQGDMNIDNTANTINDAATKIYIAPAGFYTNDNVAGYQNTIFRRLITISSTDDTLPYIEVEAKVGWQDRGTERFYTAKTLLYNWR